MRTAEEFLEIVNTLVAELFGLGMWEFGWKYCDPYQLRIAGKEAIKVGAGF